MKKQIVILMFAILLLTSMIAYTVAQETSTTSTSVSESEITIPDNETVSITPDKPFFYGLNRALERVSLALTLGKAAKAEKGLKHAEKRLLELKQMIEEKKFTEAEKALKEYEQDMDRVRARIQEFKDENNPKLELEQKLKLQNKLELLENNEDRLETTVQVKVFGNLSEQEQEKVNQMIELLQNNTTRAVIWMNDSITGARIRIKARYALSDENVSNVVSEYENALNLTQLREQRLNASIARLERKITVANEHIAELESAGKNVTIKEEKVAIAENLLEKLKEIQSIGSYDIKDVVKEARIESREIYVDKKEVRAEHAAQVISNVIQKLEARQIETGKNMSSAIESLTEVQSKLQSRAEALKSKIGNVETD